MTSDTSARTGGITLQIPIRWGDMDALGHVNNTVYFRYCESARIAYFEALGGMAAPTGSEGILLVAANLNFRRPLRYPDSVEVHVRTTALSARSITMSYTLRSAADGTGAADGSSVVVWADYVRGRSLPLPEALVEVIVALENAPELRSELSRKAR
jgi:acyl-CoA thioester hydrolase